MINRIENTVPWTYVINDLRNQEIILTFYEKELQRSSQNEFRTEKIIKRKDNKLYVKWKVIIIHLIVRSTKRIYYIDK